MLLKTKVSIEKHTYAKFWSDDIFWNNACFKYVMGVRCVCELALCIAFVCPSDHCLQYWGFPAHWLAAVLVAWICCLCFVLEHSSWQSGVILHFNLKFIGSVYLVYISVLKRFLYKSFAKKDVWISILNWVKNSESIVWRVWRVVFLEGKQGL